MAISAPTKSAQYANITSTPPVLNAVYDSSPLMQKHAKLTFTSAGFTTAAAGDLQLIRMPAGKIRIYSDLSRVVCPVGTATSDLDIGYGAYTGIDGVAVVADGDALAASLDVGGGAIDAALALPAGGFLEIESKDGFDIVASFDTANSPASGDLVVSIVYTKAG
jgi:hypothetical protein